MPDDKDIKELFGTYDPESMLNQVQDTLSADSEILKGETRELRKLAEGNKALNAIQIADAARSFFSFEKGQRQSDQRIEDGFNKGYDLNLAEFDDAQRGRRDISRQLHDSETRIRTDIGRLGQVTEKIATLAPGETVTGGGIIVPNDRRNLGRTEEVAEAIRVGAMPTALGSNKNVVAATKSLGAFTRGISTDGVADSDKIAALHKELDTDKNLKSTFENYLQAARKVTSTVNPSDKDVHAFERHRDTLKASGKFQSFDDDLLNSRMTMGDKLKGMIPGRGRDLPHIQFAKDVKEIQRQSGLKDDSLTRARTRAEMFGDPVDTRTGIDDEGGEQIKELKKISKSTNETSKKLDGMGGSLLGLLVAGMAIWGLFKVGNTKVDDLKNFFGLGDGGMDDAGTGVQKLPYTGTSLAEKLLRKTPFIGKPIANVTAKLTQPLLDAAKVGGQNVLEGGGKVAGKVVDKIAGKATEEVIEEAVEATAEKVVKEGAEKVLQEGGEQVAETVIKEGTEQALKGGAKASAMVAKKFPILGLVIGTGFAGYRALQGDMEGAAMEMGSGLASTLPGWGTAASVGADGYLIYRDFQRAQLDAAKEEGMFNKVVFGQSSIDKDADWTAERAKAILEFEKDDISEEDQRFLQGVIDKASTMDQVPDAFATVGDGLTDALNQITNNVTVNNLQQLASNQPQVEIVPVVDRAGVSSKSHSFQRLNDQTFGPSYG